MIPILILAVFIVTYTVLSHSSFSYTITQNVDWWLMYRHDPQHTGYSTLKAPDKNRTFWIKQFGDWVRSSPAVHNNVIFIGSDDGLDFGRMSAVNATTGEEIWSYGTGGDVVSSAAVAYGHVYFGSDDRKFYCVDETNGNFAWSFQTGGIISSSPCVTQNKVVFGSDDCRLYCLDAATGSHLWNYSTLGKVLSSPAVADDKVFFGSFDREVYALNLNSGALIWSYNTASSIFASPSVVDNKVFIAAYNVFYCLDESNGNFVWSYTTGGAIHSSSAIAWGNVYFGCNDNNMYCLSATNGQLKWKFTTGDIIYSSPAAAHDKVFFGSNDKKVYCLNATTGALIWSYNTGGSIKTSSPAVANRFVYVASSYYPPFSGKLFAFGPFNTAPMATSLTITPESPLTTDNLTGSYNYYDGESDPEYDTEIKWYKNDVLQPEYNDTLVIPSTSTAKAQRWHFTVRPKDGMDFGTTQESPYVTVLNSPPSIDGVNVVPDPAYTTSTLTATPCGWYDADGDAQCYVYQWQKWDGMSWQNLSGATSGSLTCSYFVKGDQMKVICTPYDGTDCGTPEEDTITISNSPPTDPVVDVTPKSPHTTDDLTCTVTSPSSDPDGDTIAYTYEWYRNGGLQSALTTVTTDLSVTISSSNTAKGEVWRSVVTPNDGTENGPTAQDEVMILNTLPTQPVVDVTPNTPDTANDLTCTITTTSTDPDEDTITYTYEWYRDKGAGFILQPALTTVTTALNVTIDSSNTTKIDVWKCVVTPNDGTANGPSDNDNVVIRNSPPSIDSVTISPDPAYTTDTLAATPYGWHDADGDAQCCIYQWQKWVAGNWQNISGATSQTLSCSNFVKNDHIKAICTPFDGVDYGTSEEDIITISNTPPTIDFFAPTDTTPEVNEEESLEFTQTSSDPDGDPLTYSWLLDSVEQSAGQNWTYSPSYDDAGIYNVTLVVSDSELIDSQQWIVTVINVNRSPVIDTFYPLTHPTISEGESQEFNITYHDPDGDIVSVQWYLEGTPTGTDDSYSFVSDYDSAGIYNVIVVVSDGYAQASHEWILTVLNVNRSPTIDSHYPSINPMVQEGESQEFNITKSDLDGDPLTVIWWLNQTDTGETSDSYMYTADYESAGTYKITVVVSDGLSETSHQWTLTVTNIERDVAIIDVIQSKNVVGEAYPVSINVTIMNQGELTENFNVTLYANTTIIGTLTNITLPSGNSTTITFTWNTTGMAKGNYTISAAVDAVPGETDLSDNDFTDGWVVVTIPGDVDGNFWVEIYDIVKICVSYNSKMGDPQYKPNLDMDGDGDIDIFDVVIACIHYGQKDP
jgi:outer membrane protein assembly factor BamB